jgi:hypothetical protein
MPALPLPIRSADDDSRSNFCCSSVALADWAAACADT